ncbi:MAG: helix-turn-helix domain-containing protein [Alphaproteobacteria bacterium]
MDRGDTVRLVRERLGEVLRRSGLSGSAFAHKVGVDRATLSQLLSPGNDRLPRAETIAAIAQAEKVSVDWLLGLSHEGHLGADIVRRPLEIEPGASSPADERLARWHAEAIGYKIRYVPTTLPDLLKTEEVIRYEFREFAPGTPNQRIENSQARLAYQRRPETDMEVCSAYQTVEAFARGEGIWRELPAKARDAQLQRMIAITQELYPTFRWFLHDGLSRFSVPFTIFGPGRAAVYMGEMYFVFNSTEHIRVLTRHFDELIRAAIIQPPDVAAWLTGLRAEVEGKPSRREAKVGEG